MALLNYSIQLLPDNTYEQKFAHVGNLLIQIHMLITFLIPKSCSLVKMQGIESRCIEFSLKRKLFPYIRATYVRHLST